MYPKDANFLKRPICLQGDARTDKIYNSGYGNYPGFFCNVVRSTEWFMGKPCIDANQPVGMRFVAERNTKLPANQLLYKDAVESFTFRGWFKLEKLEDNATTPYNTLFTMHNGQYSTIAMFVVGASRTINVITVNGSSANITSTFPMNTWTYVDFRFRKGTGYKVIINGVVNIIPFTGSPAATDTVFCVGSTYKSTGTSLVYSFYGKMQDIVFEQLDTYDNPATIPTDLTYGESPLDVSLAPFAMSPDPRPINPNLSADYQKYGVILQGNSDGSIANSAPNKKIGNYAVLDVDQTNPLFGQPSFRFTKSIGGKIKFPASVVPVESTNNYVGTFTATCWHKAASTPVTNFHSIFGSYNGSQGFSLFLNLSNQYTIGGITSTATPLNTWNHIRVAYRFGVGYRLFVNGLLVGTATVTSIAGVNLDFFVGGNNAANDNMDGWIADATLSSLDTYDMTLPVPTEQTYTETAYNRRQMYIGNGTITGKVSIAGVPSSDSLAYLYDEETGNFVAKVQCDEDGKFTFNNLRKDILYYVVAKNSDETWEYKVSSRRMPV